MLERWFGLEEFGTRAGTEISAGCTTFFTMAYILFVQPAMLASEPAGMDFGSVVAATCLTSAFASILMGLFARYPIALAPGMGINAYFTFVLIPAAAQAGHPEPWRAALAIVFVAGVIFLLLTLVGVREHVMNALSPSLRAAIASGIGLFLVFIGLRNAGWVVDHPATLVTLERDFTQPAVVVSLVGLLVGAIAIARGLRAGLLLGIAASTCGALILRFAIYGAADAESMPGFRVAESLFAWPPSLAPTFLALDLSALTLAPLIPFVFVFLFIDVFDTMGTLLGVGQQAGLLRDGKLPRANRALASDAVATIVGAALGTSTVTSYIESAAGVEQGGRSGLVAVTVGVWFLVALFALPLISMLGSYLPITAPVLLLVGAAMLRSTSEIEWKDPSESIPALLILAGIPFSFSIGDGIALGLVAYPLIKLGAGRAREVAPALFVVAALLVLYFLLLRG